MTGSASAAPTGFDRCPRGYFCLFSGLSGAGTIWKYRTSQRDLGSAGKQASSFANRTKSYSCLFGGKDYTTDGERTRWGLDPEGAAGFARDSATGGASIWRHHFGSLRLAPTFHECQSGKEYLEWIRPEDDPAGTPKPFGSFFGNGQSQVLARSVRGRLWVLPGDGTKPTDLGTALSHMTAVVRHGDYTGDKREDIIARDTKGDLWLYPQTSAGRLGSRKLLGHGWNGMATVAAVGDLTGDKKNDLVGRDKSGNLWLYPGNGKGSFGKRQRIAHGWTSVTAVLDPGDLTLDGRDDLIARDTKGDLWLYPGLGKGRFAKRALLGHNFSKYWKYFAIGDLNGDRRSDLYVVNRNALMLYLGTTKGRLTKSSSWGFTDLGIDDREILF
ncbi:FG-GAP-like repeat-containing protein [Planotetraspora thailandica]|nr:FG-GAP-like repeat-containing protein [Planotetraspora thailandica]